MKRFGAFRGHYLRVRRERRGLVSGIALVDVAILVGFYVYTFSSFILQPGIRIELPPAAFTTGASYDDLVLTIVDENMVFFNDERIALQDFPAHLRRARDQHEGAGLLIEADGRIRHEVLVRIYNMARGEGVADITLATGLLEPPPPGGP